MRLKTLAEIALLLGLTALQIQIWFNPDGLAKLINLRVQQSEIQNAIAQFDHKNQALTREIIGLTYDKKAIEEQMRHELGVIKSGETFFFIADQ